MRGALAQLVERNNGIVEVNGSIPLRSIASMDHYGGSVSFFRAIKKIPADPILGLIQTFESDPNPHKVNLAIGVYQDEQGRFRVLDAVRQAEMELIQQGLSKDYLPIDGDAHFVREALKLVLGPQYSKVEDGLVFATQAIGGTSALRIGSEFLKRHVSRQIVLSDPSWPNHQLTFSMAGMQVDFYKYYDPVERQIDFPAMCACLKNYPPGCTVLLQACCHNPTGLDLTVSQWEEISHILKKHSLIPFFDCAYMGFSVSIDEDVQPIRYFAEQGHEMLVALSCSKNFGLYGERVGLIAFFTAGKKNAMNIQSQVKQIIRSLYSNPPRFGVAIVAKILQSPELTELWKQDLQKMRNRIHQMREELTRGLKKHCKNREFSFNAQQGMFSLTGLSLEQIRFLREEYSLYLLENSRISIPGLTAANLDYVTQAISSIVDR